MTRARIFCHALIALMIFNVADLRLAERSFAEELPETCYLFSYFVGNGEDGLHLCWSRDGFSWKALNGGASFLKPEVGESKLMRDPCLLLDTDGTFRMVWTTSWTGHTIGYASSQDLIEWTSQRAISVMAHEPDAKNCWAPEITYDAKRKQYLIIWATTIPGRFEQTAAGGDNGYNHRMYCTTTSNFRDFSPTRLFFDPGFNVIDATFLSADDRHYLIVKNETLKPVCKHLQIAVADDIEGPYRELSPPFTTSWVEGPSVLRIGADYVVYFDAYREHHYGAMMSRDLKNWQDVTDRLSFPAGVRHGTMIAVPRAIVRRLLDQDAF